MATTLLLVRHGQTVWNPQGRLRGRSDIALDEVGKVQAEATARYIADHWQPAHIYTSPLKRTQQTASEIATATGAALHTHNGLLDVDFGAWEGRLPEDLEAHWGEAWQAWRERPQSVMIPGGETLRDAQNRATLALREVVTAHLNEVVVVVSHTAINRLLLLAVLDVGLDHFWHLGQDLSAVNVLTYSAQAFTLEKLNLTHHLRDVI
jgi:probable phosphoglycerate mutase